MIAGRGTPAIMIGDRGHDRGQACNDRGHDRGHDRGQACKSANNL
jgi:hypothetical protein